MTMKIKLEYLAATFFGGISISLFSSYYLQTNYQEFFENKKQSQSLTYEINTQINQINNSEDREEENYLGNFQVGLVFGIASGIALLPIYSKKK